MHKNGTGKYTESRDDFELCVGAKSTGMQRRNEECDEIYKNAGIWK